MTPLVSVITPVFNSEKFVSETIQSVQRQTFSDWEMILVDDFSTDNSIEEIENFACEDERIKLIKLSQNSGPAVARNHAIKGASGRYIAFLDSDDLWLPEKLEVQINWMQTKNLVLTFSQYKIIDIEGHETGKIIDVPEKVNYAKLLNFNVIGCLTAVYDSKILGKVFMPEILKRQDYGLWLKVLKRGFQAHGIKQPLALYRTGKDSVSSNKLKAATYNWKILYKHEKLSFPKAIFHFTNYIFTGLKKYYF